MDLAIEEMVKLTQVNAQVPIHWYRIVIGIVSWRHLHTTAFSNI